MKALKPDVVIGTGGYVSGPVLLAGLLCKIPIAIQEQNASVGLTNAILARWRMSPTLPWHRGVGTIPSDAPDV